MSNISRNLKGSPRRKKRLVPIDPRTRKVFLLQL